MSSDDRRIGTVAAVRGGVVDVVFADGPQPLHHLLVAGDDVRLELVALLDRRTARCAAVAATEGLACGDAARGTGEPIRVPVARDAFDRVFEAFRETIDGESRTLCLHWEVLAAGRGSGA